MTSYYFWLGREADKQVKAMFWHEPQTRADEDYIACGIGPNGNEGRIEADGFITIIPEVKLWNE